MSEIEINALTNLLILPREIEALNEFISKLTSKYVEFAIPLDRIVSYDRTTVQKHFKEVVWIESHSEGMATITCYFKKEMPLSGGVSVISFVKVKDFPSQIWTEGFFNTSEDVTNES